MATESKTGIATESKTGVTTTQVYEVYIKASPQAIWDAITSPEWTVKYGYQGAVDYELRPGGAYRAHSTPEMRAMGLQDVIVDGVVEEADPPRKLVHTYRFLFSEAMKAEGFTRVTWEIEKAQPVSRGSPWSTSSRARQSWPAWWPASSPSRARVAGPGFSAT